MSTTWKNWAKLFVLALVMTGTVQLSAQTPTDNSPYSRYGLGNLISPNFGAVTGMANISTAYNNYGSVNLNNPASLGFLYTTSFETGLQSELNWLSANDGTSDFTADGNLSHIVLGFPLKNPLNKLTELKRSSFNWGTAFGITPYSKVAYDIETESILPNIDTVVSRTRGTGGLYQVSLSNGVSYEGYAAGLTIGYLFGKIDEDRTTIFSNVSNPFTNVFTDETNYGGFIYKFGLQKQFVLGEDNKEEKSTARSKRKQTKLTVGIAGNNSMSLSTETTSLNRRFNNSYGFDTITSTNEVLGNTILPSAYSFGVTLSEDNHWLVGVDYSIARWGEYSNPSKTDSLKNSFRIGFGAQYTPDVTSFNSYLKRVVYRVGGFYELDPRVVAGEQLISYGGTVGFGLPITLPKKGTVGYTNLGLEVGKIGVGSPIGETYMRITAAFTLNDNTWFYKRKFD